MKSTRPNVFIPRKPLLVSAVLAALAVSPIALATDDIDKESCSARTLRGVYQFHADGYVIMNGAALPKAIIETLIFDGRGNVSTPAVSLNVNGTVIQPPQGSPGIYTLDADCTGTLTFGDGVMFDLQVKPTGKALNMLQTSPQNHVMQGTGLKVSSLSAWGGQFF